jgi:hypothetical protein
MTSTAALRLGRRLAASRWRAGVSAFLTRVRPHVCLFLLLLALFPLLFHFFEWFPNGWDQAEYSWCLRSNYLPHSPYILFILLGRFLYLFADAPVALAILSLLSGVGSVIMLYYVSYRSLSLSYPQRLLPAPAVSSFAATIAGGSYLFVRQSTSQEAYPLLTCLLLLAVALAISPLHHRDALAGVGFGCAVAAHNAAVYVMPAVLCAVVFSQPKGRLRRFTVWSVAAGMTGAFFGLIIFTLLPARAGESQWHELASYLRGISPGLSPTAWTRPGFWARSLEGLYVRLTALDIPSSRMPMATSALGFGPLHGIASAAGFVILLGRGSPLGWFCVLWAAPYLAFEVALGRNVDYGVYLPFVLPPIAVLSGVMVAWFPGPSASGSRWLLAAITRGVLCCMLLWPSARLMARHWNDPTEDAITHFSPTTLAAIWASDNLPRNAIIIQPRSERNVNVLPYYSNRQHLIRYGSNLKMFDSLGPYTRMNSKSYQTVTTSMLAAVIRSGRPVYAFERDPMMSLWDDSLDTRAFVWVGETTVDLDTVKPPSAMPASLRQRLRGGSMTVYRAFLRSR